MPNFYTNFVVETDAIGLAVSVVLMQHDWAVAFMLNALNSVQCNYHTMDYEFLAIVLAHKRWYPCLDGKKTVI